MAELGNVTTKYTFSLDDKAKNFTKEHLNEDESLYEQNIKEVLMWLDSQSNINARRDELNIIRFLRGGKFDLEKVKAKMSAFYIFRSKTPEWYSNRDPLLPELQQLLNLGVFLPLLEKDSLGRQVVIIQAAVHDPKIHLQNDVFKLGNMIMELAFEQDESISIYGVVAILDIKGVTFSHARQMTPGIIKKAVHSWQNCYPLRPKSFDVINAPSYVNIVLNIFRQFMNSKLKKRIHVHGNYDLTELHKKITPCILPEEYGGKSGKLDDLICHWRSKVNESRDWFLADEKYKAQLN